MTIIWLLTGMVCSAAAFGQGLSTNSIPTVPTASGPTLEDAELQTPTRTSKKPAEIPYSTERISGVRLRNEQMAASVPEALFETAGVLAQQTAHGQGSPFLRGFTGFRTLMLVDGIRLNNSTFREGPNQYWSTVDAFAVERLEVVKGPGSVLYGSDAIGGTVNALMRSPLYGYNEQTRWSGAAYYRFASAERAHGGRGEFGATEASQWGFNFGLSSKTFGDVEGGEDVGRQPHTGYDQWDGDAKFDYFLLPNLKLTLAYQRTEQRDVERTHRTIYGITWRGLSRGSDLEHRFDQERELAYARLALKTDREDEFSTTVSWHRQDEFQFVRRANGTGQQNDTYVDTLGLNLQGTSPSRAGKWTYGVEYYRDWVDAAQRNYSAGGDLTSVGIQGVVAGDSNYDLIGAYLQDDIELSEKWTLILGGRYTFARADAGVVRDPVTTLARSYEEDWHSAIGNARLLWNPDGKDRTAIFAGASQGFRAPNLSDVSRFDIARSGELETAAFDLEPEKFSTLEAGAKIGERKWSASAAYYYTFIDDLIVRTPTGAIIGGNAEVTKKKCFGRVCPRNGNLRTH